MPRNSISLNELANNIRNSLRGGRSSNNDYYTLDQVKKQVKYYRATFIRRDQERNFNRFRLFEQDLGHVDVSLVDRAESSSISANKLIMRTDSRIPTLIRLKGAEGITFVGCKDKFGKPFPLIDAHRAYWRQYDKYTSQEVEVFYQDGYVYVTNDEELETVNIRGIFEDPEEVHNFTAANGLSLYDEDSPFPIPLDMVEGITKAILNGEGKLAVTSVNDTEADNLQGD